MWKQFSMGPLREPYEYDLAFADMRLNSTVISNVKNPEDAFTLSHALTRASIVEKWNLKFSGEDDYSVSEFLVNVELNARADNLCKDDVYTIFFRLLKGHALQWYEAYYDTYSNWNELIAGLKNRFQPIEYNFYLREEIKLRKQQIDESVQVYLTHMVRLFKKLDPPLSEIDKVFILQNNMLTRYSMQLVIRNVKSVDQITKLCKIIDEGGHQEIISDRPLEPSCHPLKKISRRNLPRPLQMITLNKFVSGNTNCESTQLPVTDNSKENVVKGEVKP